VGVVRDVTALAQALEEAEAEVVFDMRIDELLHVLLEPVAFDRTSDPIGPPLAQAAAWAGATPSLLLICYVAATHFGSNAGSAERRAR
jgi:hypothetical protein